MSQYEGFRRMIRDLNLDARRDLEAVWRSSSGDPAALRGILEELVQTYGDAAASLSADWYDAMRANAGVRPGFSAIVPDPKTHGTSQLVNWATATATDEEAFKSLIVGGLQRRITNYSRNVITRSSIIDPHSKGWMRVGRGSCGFCAMLISRGSVYTKMTVNFKTHDHCNCNAAPAWSPSDIHEIRKKFVPSARERSEGTRDADNARAAAWIARNL